MEKLKKKLWNEILDEVDKSTDEKLKDKLKCFKNREEMIDHIKFYSQLSFDNMKRSSGFDYWIRKRIYHISGERLLGTKTKAMPDWIYLKVIDYVGKVWGNKIKLALEFEGIEGPRGEDVVRVKLEDFNFELHSVSIKNRKSGGRVYQVPLNPEIEAEILEHIHKNYDQIKKHKNYVFFSNNPVQIRNHLSERYLKNVVHKALEDLNLNQIYAYDKLGRPRYLYSLHSFRGHAASRIFKKSNGDYKRAQEILDHMDLSTTLLYLEKDNMQDLKDVI